MDSNIPNGGNTPKALEPIQRATVEEILEHYPDHPQASAMLFNYYSNAHDCHEQEEVLQQYGTLEDYYREHPLPLALLQDRVENDICEGIRQAAVEAIGKYYHDDPQIYSWLCDRAQNPEDGYVRRAAVETIGKYYQDNPQTYSWLCDRVQNSDCAAVIALGDYYQNEPQTLALLRDRHQNDEKYGIQEATLRQIIEHYPDDPQTLPLLQDCVQSDRGRFTMFLTRIAMNALAEHYTDDPQTLPLLLKVIQTSENGHNFNFLEGFIKLLIDHYPNDPQTLLLLHKVIQTTQTHFGLRRAIILLVQHYPNDLQTLCFLHNFAQKLINNEELNLEYTYDQQEALLKALVEYHSDDPQTLSLLLQIIQTNRKPETLVSAVELLAQHYHNNPQTLVVLHQLKPNQWWDITHKLIEVLVKYYPDEPQTLPFLLDIAQSQGEDYYNRGDALEALVHHYRNAPPVLPLLQHRARNEPNSGVREDALILLARGYRDSSETLPFLRQCIDQYVKEQLDVHYSWIVRQIGECYAGDPQLFSWLKELIQNTETPGKLRAASVEVLVDCFLSHSETIELLNNIATHEPDEKARLTAMRAIAKHDAQTKSDRPDESETLPDISIEIPEIPTDCDSDYTRLCELLKAQRWAKASVVETNWLILDKLGRKAGSLIRLEEILTLSSEVLQTIDRLWTSTSCGHFGFSIQREIYLQCGGTLDGKYPGDEVWQAFCKRVGWIVAGFLGNSEDIKFHLSSPAGHLPLWASVEEHGDCRYESIFSDRRTGLDYTKLRNLLAAGQWKEADNETYLLMLQAVGQFDAEESVSEVELYRFPCTALLTIDQLWIDASQGRFGFSIQKDIYLQSGGLLDGKYPSTEVWREFERRVGWYADKVLPYEDIVTFSIEAPVGHLPTPGWQTYTNGTIRASSHLFNYIFPRLEACKTS